MDDERVTDAEFTVISGPTEPEPIVSEQPHRKWWQGWRLRYDWATGLTIAAIAAAAGLTRLLHH